jgi:hypothetical protein
MVEFAPEVQAVADEARNGRRLLRRSLVAIRVFLSAAGSSCLKMTMKMTTR